MINDPKGKIERYADFMIEYMDTLRDIFSDAVKYQLSKRDLILENCNDIEKLETVTSRAEKIIRRYNYARNEFEDELFRLCSINSRDWDNEDEEESKT